jgi:hypothetical protein
MELTSDNVVEVLKKVLYEGTLNEGAFPEDLILVEGIVNKYAFHKERLESHREDVYSMCQQLPDEFINGGGWSFLNMCMRDDDVQWTGLHLVQEHLACMAIGLEVGYWVPSQREFWSAFPGSVPYFCVLKND